MKPIALLAWLTACATATHTGEAPDGGDGVRSDASSAPIDAPTSIADAAAPLMDGPPAPPDAHEPTQITLTQTSTTALATMTLACADQTDTTEQAYYRLFDLTALGITTPLTLSSVAFGVQSASGTQTITVHVGTYSAAAGSTLNVGTADDDWAAGDVTAIAGTTVTVTAADSGTLVTVPIATTIPGGARLLVEVRSPDDTSEHDVSFFLGASAGTETAPGYFWSPDCAATPPGTPAELGEGAVPFVITATGSY